MSLCKDLKNLGASTCSNPMQIAKRIILVPTLGSDGTVNEIDTAAGVTKTALQALFDAASQLDRFYPTPIVENVENVRAETVFHEFNGGRKIPVREGTKHFIGHFPLEQPQLYGALKAWQGQDVGMYIIDKDGNFIYQTDAATKTKVMPIPIDGDTLIPTYIEGTDAEVNMVKVEFDYSVSAKDGLMRYISVDDLDFNGLGSDVYALHTVTGTPASSVADTITVALETEFGVAVEGLTTTEIEAIDDAGDAVTVASVNESAVTPGTYTIVVTISADTTVYLQITKSRYDFSAVNALSVEVTDSL